MSENPDPKPETRPGERVAKVIARAGLCSRRDAEVWIAAGRVSVNGEVLTSPAFNVGPDDDVRVDGEPLAEPERTRLFAFHKPKGLVTTARDPEGRPTVFDALPKELPRLVAVGRLDINTEGLLLLTNDGGLARVLELPATGWLRRYRVRAHGEISQAKLDELSRGVSVDGVDYAGIEARLERQQGSNVWLTMGLREGKNREIKRVLEHLGLTVTRLIRVSFGPFELADLPEGAVQEIPTRVLRDQLGHRLAKQAHADFDSAVTPPPAPAPAPEPPRERPRRSAASGPSQREAEPRKEPPRRGPPRKRKHVSVLRAEAREEAVAERRRIERSSTSDRRGREIAVERISLARPPAAEAKPVKRPRSAEGDAFSGRRTSDQRPPARAPRGEQAFDQRRERPRSGESDTRPGGRSGGARGERGFDERREKPRSRTGGAPPNRTARSEKPFGERRERSRFGDGDARSSRSAGEHGERGSDERREKPRSGTGRAPTGRTARSEKPFGERPKRSRFGGSDARAGGFEARREKPRSQREGPSGRKPGGAKRPPRGKPPGGRPPKKR